MNLACGVEPHYQWLPRLLAATKIPSANISGASTTSSG